MSKKQASIRFSPKNVVIPPVPYQIAPFNDWDLWRMIPDPDTPIPEWLALPIDDPSWMPDIYKQNDK